MYLYFQSKDDLLSSIFTRTMHEGLDAARWTLTGMSDPVGEFSRATLGRTLIYPADDVDRAVRWAFGWDQGPHERWDAIGVETVLDACDERGRPVGGAARVGGARPAVREVQIRIE
ncbi:MAG: hypothetical protein IH939_04635 [Acidobacteria bacterium]|nr:hypothetical protein [Acidobacteriota bacterium]